MAIKKTPWGQDLISRLDKSLLDSLDIWYQLQTAMDGLSDEYTHDHMEMIDEIEAQKVPATLEPPDESTCQFFDRALDAAHCSCGESRERHLRLRLGTYRRLGQKPNPTSVCVLLSRDLTDESGGTFSGWHELDITSEKRNEYGRLFYEFPTQITDVAVK